MIGSMSSSIILFVYSFSTFIRVMLPSLSWPHGIPYVPFYSSGAQKSSLEYRPWKSFIHLKICPSSQISKIIKSLLNNVPAEHDVVGMIAKMVVTFVNSAIISHGFDQGCHIISSKIRARSLGWMVNRLWSSQKLLGSLRISRIRLYHYTKNSAHVNRRFDCGISAVPSRGMCGV